MQICPHDMICSIVHNPIFTMQGAVVSIVMLNKLEYPGTNAQAQTHDVWRSGVLMRLSCTFGPLEQTHIMPTKATKHIKIKTAKL